jgi:hypothetical protein
VLASLAASALSLSLPCSAQLLEHETEEVDQEPVWSTPQGNIQLVPKKEVLDFKPAPRREQVGDKRPEQI